MSLSLNGIRASSVRIRTPWVGPWTGDVDLDLGDLPDLPTGKAILQIATNVLRCTIDPAQSGRFGPTARARIVAGAAGWEKSVSAQHYHNDGGVITTAVLATTGAEVGETVTEVLPGRFGIDFIRDAGAASSVLDGLSWYVNDLGVTIVGPRVPTPALPTLQVLAWDARTKVATIATEDRVLPGTILTDLRFGQAKIRDVEQTWGDSGARATAWTMGLDDNPTDSGGELVGALRAIAKDAAGGPFVQRTKYRVVSQFPDGRFVLAVVNKGTGLPDLKAISLAPAVPGMAVKVPLGTIAHVAFVDGDRSQPVVVGFADGTPIEVSFGGARVVVGSEAALPVALAGPIASALAAVVTAFNAIPAGAGTAASASLAAALAPLTPQMASTKLFADGAP